MAREPVFYELDLSDEHMAQIARFMGLRKFVRKEWESMRAYRAFKIRQINLELAAAASATRDKQRPRPAKPTDPTLA